MFLGAVGSSCGPSDAQRPATTGASSDGAADSTTPGTSGAPDVVESPALDPDAAPRLADALTTDPDGDAIVEILARAGIATYRDGTSELVQEVLGPVAPIWFSEFQAGNLAREGAARSGTLGADLDALTPTRDIPPLSYLLAAYARDVSTFGAEFSRSLLADANLDDPPSVVFPGIVVAMFVADVVRPTDGDAAVGPPASGDEARSDGYVLLAASAPGPSGPCGYASKAMNDALDAASDPETYGGGLFGSILAGAASIARVVAPTVSELISNAPGIRQIRQIMAAASIVVSIGSLLRNWSVVLAGDAGEYHYQGGGGSPSSGTFNAIVDDGGGIEFPAFLRECATLAGVELPETTDAEGSGVEWTEIAGWGAHAIRTDSDDEVDESGNAELDFDTATETPLDHEYGVERSDRLEVEVLVRRSDVAEVERLIAEVIADAIGIPGIGLVVQELVEVAGDALADVVLNPRARAGVSVVSEIQSWQAAFTQPGTGGGSITLDGHSCSGLAGPWTLNVSVTGMINGSTTTMFTFDGGGQADVSWAIPLAPVWGIADASFVWSGTAVLGAGPVITATGTSEFAMDTDDFEDYLTDQADIMGAFGSSGDSLTIPLSAAPAAGECG